jgi:sulfur carrier protein ThiS
MKIFIEKSGKTVRMKKGFKSAALLLKELELNPDTVIIVRNSEVILADERLSEKDDIMLLSVVSGG